MKKYSITHDRPDCIACAACEAVSKNWTLKTHDGLADPIKAIIDESEYEENKEAADVCPVSIIHVDEIKDNDK